MYNSLASVRTPIVRVTVHHANYFTTKINNKFVCNVLVCDRLVVLKKFHLLKKVPPVKKNFNKQQIHWKDGIINKCRLKHILELQCFYTTINWICSFHQIICQKQVLILLSASQMFTQKLLRTKT